MQLLVGTPQHVECNMQGLFVLEWGSEADEGLGLGAVALLSLQTGGECGLVDLADGRHIVVGYPLPELELPGQQDGLLVYDLQDVLYLIAFGLRVVQSCSDAYILLAASKRHKHTTAYLERVVPLRWQRVGKSAVERHGEDDINKVQSSSEKVG